jgi:hypothetical protein
VNATQNSKQLQARRRKAVGQYARLRGIPVAEARAIWSGGTTQAVESAVVEILVDWCEFGDVEVAQ